MDCARREELERSAPRLGHFAACELCRKRKLRCDGIKPICGTCARASRQCFYKDIRKGIRKQRTSIKILEARLAELESRNASQQIPEEPASALVAKEASSVDIAEPSPDHVELDFDIQAATEVMFPYLVVDRADSMSNGSGAVRNISSSHVASGSIPHREISAASQVFDKQGSYSRSTTSDPSMPMISLGLEESLPSEAVQDDLYKLFFANVYPYIPAIHPSRFLTRAKLPYSSRLRPPPCLIYAIFALAASTTDMYKPVQDIFYRRARKYVELDEMKSLGELVCTVGHIQTWALLYLYESFNMFLVRSFLSERKAAALCIAAGLHKLDGVGLAQSQFLAPAEDWTELEERRRIFWVVFTQDRFMCVGSGFTPAFDEQDVQTDLPASEESFESAIFARGMKLSEAMTPAGARNVSILGARAILGSLFGRVVVQLHRPDPHGKSTDDLSNTFWTSYRDIDNVLVNTAVCFPDSLAAKAGLGDINVMFLSIAIHACSISLHQSAIFMAGKNPRLAEISNSANGSCLESASEMVSVVKQVPDSVMLQSPPFTSFCLYMAARVFVIALKAGPNPRIETLCESLLYMQGRLELVKTTRPYTANLIKQLQADAESLGDLNPTGHIIVKSMPEGGSPRRDNTSPDIANPHAIDTTQSQTATRSNFQTQAHNIQLPLKPTPTRSVSLQSTPEIHHQRPSYLSRTFSDVDYEYTASNSLSRGPTSMPTMEDLAWTENDFTENDIVVTLPDNGVRVSSAQPASSEFAEMDTGEMGSLDRSDHAALHMSMAQATFGLYDIAHDTRPSGFSSAWSSGFRWNGGGND